MNKIRIKGTHVSIYIKKLSKANYMQIQSALGKSLWKHTHLFLNDSNLKMLGFKSIDDFPTEKQYSAFILNDTDSFELLYNRKCVLRKPINRLQNHFYSLELFNASFDQVKLNYRNDNEFMYIFLKKELTGVFTASLGENILLNDIQIKHEHLIMRKGIAPDEDYVNFAINGKLLLFNSKNTSSNDLLIVL
ncbi:MAG: hypothetical protein KA734_00820 [Fluviicola sp.]|nr:hypothetical protein [Fluviicola sp.]MBP6271343.1 hypothetical protein [Fluviicola sp.]